MNSRKNINIKYEGYILLFTELSGVSATTRDSSTALNSSKTIEQFKAFCDSDRKCHKDYAELWLDKPPEDGRTVSKDERKAKLDEIESYYSYLYQPKIWISLDNPDKALGLVLADRIDFAQELNSNAYVDSNKITMGFCPCVDELAPDLTDCAFLHAPRTLFECEDKIPPLQVFSKIRLNILSTIGPTLWIQKALHRAVVGKIRELLNTFKFHPDYDDICGCSDSSSWSIDDLSVCILDTQDWAELALLIHTHDYRLSTAIIVAVSCISVEDLVAAAKALDFGAEFVSALQDQELSSQPAVSVLAGLNTEVHTDLPLEKNHVCSAMFTTSNVRDELYFQVNDSERSGRLEKEVALLDLPMVLPVPKFDYFEGHDVNFHRELGDISDRLEGTDLRGVELDARKWFFIENGRFDSAFYIQRLRNEETLGEIISLRNFFKLDWKIKQMFGTEEEEQRSDGIYNVRRCWYKINTPVSKDLAELKVGVSCPTLASSTPAGCQEEARIEFDSDESYYTRHLYLEGVSRSLARRIFGNNSAECKAQRKELGVELLTQIENENWPNHRGINIPILEDSMRILAIESTLNREIISLFKSFKESLSDTYSASAVIDLWDPFLNLYDFLVQKAGEMVKRKKKLENGNDLNYDYETFPVLGYFTPALPFVGVKRKDIEDYLNHLKESLKMRMRDSLEREGTRLSSVSSRMASVQLLSAADSLVKCCGGVLKDYRKFREAGSRKKGGVGENPMFATLISSPGISVDLVNLESGEESPFAGASININLGHLTHSDALSSYIHEAGHLLYPFFLRESRTPDFYDSRIPKEYRTNLEEIFCDQAVLCWVFGDDFKLYERTYIAYILTNPSSGNNDSNDGIEYRFHEFIDYIIRLYFISIYSRRNTKEPIVASVNEAKEFSDWALELIAQYIPKLLGNLSNDEKCELLEETFIYHTPFYGKWGFKSWNFIKGVGDELVFSEQEKLAESERSTKEEKATDGDKQPARQNWEFVENNRAYVRKALKEGRAISRLNLHENLQSEEPLDPLRLIRYCILELAKITHGEKMSCGIEGLCGVRSYVARDRVGRVSIPNSRKATDKDAVIDVRRCSYFSFSPSVSEKLLQAQIASIKTFWDISGILKARRFEDMSKRAGVVS